LILGIPVFFDIGIFVVAPLGLGGGQSVAGARWCCTRCRCLAGLSMTHAFLPAATPVPLPPPELLPREPRLADIMGLGLACGQIPAWLAAGVVVGAPSSAGGSTSRSPADMLGRPSP